MKEENFGLDLGNGYIKYENGCFQSKIRKGTITSIAGIKKAKNVHQVKINGEEWVLGEGASFTGKERYFEKPYEIALYTAIALSVGKKPRNPVEANIVVGLPVNHYNSLAEKVQNHIQGLGIREIEVNGVYYIIEIKSVNVFIEGAYPIMKNDDSHMITIDVGAGTVNIIEWKEQEIVDKYTNNGSFNEMYEKISTFLNEKHDRTLTPEMVEDLIGQDTMETGKGTVEIREDVDAFLKATVDNILSYTTKFNWEGAKYVKVFGGGALDTFTHWKNKIPKADLVPECQFINAKVYKTVAEAVNEE